MANRVLNRTRLLALPEWIAIADRMQKARTDYTEFCIAAESFDKKEYYRGKREAIDFLFETVDDLLEDDDGSENEG